MPAGSDESHNEPPQAATAVRPRVIHESPLAPDSLPAHVADRLPETLRYRFKNRVLGPPIATERQATERLGRPTALAVLSSDVISSSAYATEQILYVLVRAVGIAAFTLVMPITLAVIGVLVFVTLSYLEVVKVYTKAGGAYVVSRENFGPKIAQIAVMSLLIDYTLTVAVSVAAGVAALTSVFSSLQPWTVEIASGLVLLIAYANLRGVREAGRVFALPTYFFILNMVILIVAGAIKAISGSLHAHALTGHPGAVTVGRPGEGLLLGASLFVVMRAFASGGSALTGTEAISNGVSVFRRPEARNARITMLWMSTILGALVLGIGALAAIVHPIPYESGTPTVVSQIAKYVYGTGGFGTTFYVLLQGSTMLILVLAANTSFTGFPYLASFAAEDSYLPRQLMKRGHRLVFSTGIIVLTAVSILLLIVTRAQVDKLIPLYAIGVFTGFTMAGLGMAKYHLTHKEEAWKRRFAINGTAGILSGIVDIIIAVSKFGEGAWVVVILLPVGVGILLLLHRQYTVEETELEEGALDACEVPVLRRHAVVVLIDRLDLATARAIQYARTLTPDSLRIVHFAVDPKEPAILEAEWRRLGLSSLPLDIIDCPDRRLARAALELAADSVADGQTELSILLPRRGFTGGWRRLLHDRSADRIAAAVSILAHVNATIVPYQLSRGLGPFTWAGRVRGLGRMMRTVDQLGNSAQSRRQAKAQVRLAVEDATISKVAGTTPIGQVEWRHRVRVAGKVSSVRVPTRTATANLECTLSDRTGSILLVFQGRRHVPGIQQGARLVAEGMVGAWMGRKAMLNPDYELLSGVEGVATGAAPKA
ncbi:MAG: amino acid permease [Acidimicrobiales bacterium]